MAKKYRKFSPEFRVEAVRMVIETSRPIAQVAKELGVNDGTLGNWVKAARDAKARAGDPEGLSESERVELQRLRKEVVELRTDREILRKAAAYFARETMR